MKSLLKQLGGICWCILIRENSEIIRNFFKSDQFCPNSEQVILTYLSSPTTPTSQQMVWIHEYIEIVNTCFSLVNKMNKEDASDHELLNGMFRKIVFRWGKLRETMMSVVDNTTNGF